MDLPVYELKINEAMESMVDAIAIVESPAIESNFIAFSKEQANLTFSMDDSKMELLGAAMIPNMNIYRRGDDGEEYYVFFSKETIRNIAQVFFKKGYQVNINLDHTSASASSYAFQSFIVDEANGINSPKGLNLPDGSWVVGVKVTDPVVWSDIKEGKRKGFSVEGVFQLFEDKFDSTENEILELVKKINSLIFKI